MAGKQTFGLDFDDTFTADPELWSFFIAKAHTLGHQVICVSARLNIEGNLRELTKALPSGVQVILSEAIPKRKHVETEGITIDVWIDDHPDGIVGPTISEQAAWERCEVLQLLVEEARSGRDLAEQKAKEAVQKEMAELRAEITRLKSIREDRYQVVKCTCGGSVMCDGSCDTCGELY